MTGSLPSHLPSTSKLVNISFAHNRLTGTIPKFLRKSPYSELCLSYNKFTGSLNSDDFYQPLPGSEDESSRLILALENNRFSGFVPKHLNLIPTLTILQGNLFDCDPQHTLPSNDPKHRDYVCGSKQLDQALIFWGCVIAIWAIIFVLTLSITCQNLNSGFHDGVLPSHTKVAEETHFFLISHHTTPPRVETLTSPLSQLIQNILLWNHFGKIESLLVITKQFKIHNLDYLKTFLFFLKMIRKVYCSVCLVILFFGIPLYLSLKSTKSSTHEYQYGWLFSAAYMSGSIPAVSMMVFYSLINCLVGYSFVSLYSMTQVDQEEEGIGSESKEETNDSSDPPHSIKKNFQDITVQELRSDQGVGLEEEPVRAEIDVKTTFARTHVASPITSSHRLIQSVVYGTLIGINILIYLSANSLYVYVLLSGSQYVYRILAKVGISLFALSWNMFLLPSILEYFSSSIQDHFGKIKWILIFLLLFNNIAVPGLATAASDPSCFDVIFIYQNKINAYYSYIYCEIYSIIPSSVGGETESECIKYSVSGVSTSYSPPFFYNYSCASAILENYIPVYFILYSLLALFPIFTYLLFQSSYEISSYLPNSILQFVPYLWRAPTSYPFQFQYPSSKLFKPNRIICNTLSHLSVLMTFGLAYPFLALAIVVAMCVVTWYHELSIGRYLQYRFSLFATTETMTRDDITGGMNSACSAILSGFSTSLWTILIGSSILFSFLIFDFAGDEIPRDHALWLAGLACILPILLGWLSFKFASHLFLKKRKSERKEEYEILPVLEDEEFE